MSTNTGSPFNFTLPQDTDLADFVNVFLKPQLTALNTYALHSTATQVLVNKSIADATDNSKTLGFNLAGTAAGLSTTLVASATGTSKTITLPNLTDTLVGRTTTDTLTNKTLTSPSITSPSITSPTISSGGLIVSAGNVGIGTSSPTEKLSVLDGNFVISKTSYGGFLKWTQGTTSPKAGNWEWGDGTGWRMDFGPSATPRLSIYDNGNVGIGTASPGRLLQVAASASTAGIIRITSNAQAANGIEIGHGYGSGTDNIAWILNRANADFVLGTNNAENIRITASGNVGIGKSAYGSLTTNGVWLQPNDLAHISATTSNGVLYINQNGAGPIVSFLKAGVEKFQIDTNGNVGIGTSSPAEKLHVNGNVLLENNNGYYIKRADGTVLNFGRVDTLNQMGIGDGNVGSIYFASTSRFFYNLNGSYIANIGPNGLRIGDSTAPGYQLHLTTDSAAKPTSNTWTISSDARVKEVIGSYTRGVADIMALEPKRYRLNGAFGSVDDGRVHVSVVAQEAQATWPEMIGTYEHTDKDEDDVETVTELLNLNTNELQWALVNAIKELAQRVEALEVHG